MTKEIKAIPTRYRGILFRSRLEARWACFFDAAGLPWEYEPERFSLGGRSTYLPDFKVNGTSYVEIKGAEKALDKPYLMRAATTLKCLTVLGPVPDCTEGIPGRTVLMLGATGQERYALGLYVSWHDYRPGAKRQPRVTMARAQDNCHWLDPQPQPGPCRGDCPYDAARSARFEHGQSGRT